MELVSYNRACPVHEINTTDILKLGVRAVLSPNFAASSREVTKRVLNLLEALGIEQQQSRRILHSLAPIHAPTHAPTHAPRMAVSKGP